MDEAKLLETLARLEALAAGTTHAGERVAATEARQRILERLQAVAREAPPVEFKFTFADAWSRKLFVALLRRYDLQPYRYRGQRYTTVMVMVPKRFVDETLWPEFVALEKPLREYLDEVTERVIRQAIHQDSSEASEVDAPRQLGGQAGGA